MHFRARLIRGAFEFLRLFAGATSEIGEVGASGVHGGLSRLKLLGELIALLLFRAQRLLCSGEFLLDVLNLQRGRFHLGIARGLRGDGVGELRLQRFVGTRALAGLHALQRALRHVRGGHLFGQRRGFVCRLRLERGHLFRPLGLGGFHLVRHLEQFVLGLLFALDFVLLIRPRRVFLDQLLGQRVGASDQLLHLTAHALLLLRLQTLRVKFELRRLAVGVVDGASTIRDLFLDARRPRVRLLHRLLRLDKIIRDAKSTQSLEIIVRRRPFHVIASLLAKLFNRRQYFLLEQPINLINLGLLLIQRLQRALLFILVHSRPRRFLEHAQNLRRLHVQHLGDASLHD